MRRSLAPVLLALTLALAPAVAGAQEPDRSVPPTLGPPPAFDPPPVERFTLTGGLDVLLVESHDVPLVQVDVVVRAGAVDDPAEKRGLAGMVAAMLDEGAGGRSALELAEAVETLGAELSTGAGAHTTVVRLHAPVARLEPALGILADVVRRPAFPPEELERQRMARLTTLLQWRDEPAALASIWLSRSLYGEAHPYGSPILGTALGLAALSASDLEAFHSARFGPARATLIVVGDVTREGVTALLEAAFGDWGGDPTATAGAPPDAGQVAERRIYLVDVPGAPQTEIRIGRIGVPRRTEDYHALEVMNTILGGSFSARLNQNLREDKGYSYGAFSYFDYRPAAGLFVALAAVQTEVTAPALTEFVRELEAILEPVSGAELERARNYLALGFPQAFQTVAGTAAMLAELVAHDLPIDTYDRYVEEIQAVTAADVQRVARATLDPARVTIVVVGDRAQVEAPVEALGLGPVEVLAVDDVLGPAPDLAAGRVD